MLSQMCTLKVDNNEYIKMMTKTQRQAKQLIEEHKEKIAFWNRQLDYIITNTERKEAKREIRYHEKEIDKLKRLL